ncbi:hypothetical protein CRUP_037805 [Coryphaenoides rupestris]|nr:hypothetical protein CRUP_037805 [Coryphaenoides rupestris]
MTRAHVLVALCIVLGVICVGQLIAILVLNGKTSAFQKPQASNVEPQAICNATEPLSCQSPQEVPKSPESYRCPNDWEFFENSCFFLSKDRLNWTQQQGILHHC